MVDEVKKVAEDAVVEVRESAGTTPKNAKPAASIRENPELTADEINAKQAEAAKAAGKEYQGQQPRPSVKDMAVEKTAPASGKAEQA